MIFLFARRHGVLFCKRASDSSCADVSISKRDRNCFNAFCDEFRITRTEPSQWKASDFFRKTTK